MGWLMDRGRICSRQVQSRLGKSGLNLMLGQSVVRPSWPARRAPRGLRSVCKALSPAARPPARPPQSVPRPAWESNVGKSRHARRLHVLD